MALDLAFELRLEERGAERVVVSVLLAPSASSTRIDGVALQLVTRTGEPIGVRMLLPISGELLHPMLSTVELKASEGDEIATGTRVVGTAWFGAEQREAMVPTDPFTELEQHMRARKRLGHIDPELTLRRLEPEERRRIALDFPWVDEPRLPKAVAELGVVENDENDDVDPLDDDDLVENLGLDEDNAAWLKDLLNEDEPA